MLLRNRLRINFTRCALRTFHFAQKNCEQTPKISKQEENPFRRPPHPFKQLFPWKTRSEFANYIQSCICYESSELVALNKPYGVKIHKEKAAADNEAPKNTRYTSLLATQEDYPYSIEDVLPELKSRLRCPELYIVKSVERYASGIVLMSTSLIASEKAKKCMIRAKQNITPNQVYWAVTRGCPVESARKEKVGIKLVDVDAVNEKQPIVVTHYTSRDKKFKRVKLVQVEYRTLMKNKEMPSTLMEISVSSARWHFLRVYASSRAASILGDPFYGSRMRMVLGKPVQINPENLTAYDVQPLSQLMAKELDLPPTVQGYCTIPTMLHLRTLILPNFYKKEDVQITVPPPHHFLWTCSQLGLLPEGIFDKTDNV